MSSMIQVRNVPESVHRKLKARAAAAGMSLSDYIKRDLVESAAAPTLVEIDARVRAERRRGAARGTRRLMLVVDASALVTYLTAGEHAEEVRAHLLQPWEGL